MSFIQNIVFIQWSNEVFNYVPQDDRNIMGVGYWWLIIWTKVSTLIFPDSFYFELSCWLKNSNNIRKEVDVGPLYLYDKILLPYNNNLKIDSIT